MALSKEVIDAINSFNGLSQRLGVGQVISDAIDNNTHNNVVETPKIAHHDKLEGAVTVAALKSAYNSLIDDLIKAGLMEE